MGKKSGKYILLYRHSDMENSMSYEKIPRINAMLGLENFKLFGSLLSEIWILNDNLSTCQMIKLQMNTYWHIFNIRDFKNLQW